MSPLLQWIIGSAFFISFLLTFWPTRGRMILAAVLFAAGLLPTYAIQTYSALIGTHLNLAPTSGGISFEEIFWFLFVLIECALLFPWIPRATALKIGMGYFLVVLPVIALASFASRWKLHLYDCPFTLNWLALPLLWFRIREAVKDKEPRYADSGESRGVLP